jgi:succinate dehydrogenase / fumarate reductase, flavoprotein subunit
MPAHDVLIIGAGLAGQRAALAAAQTGASVAVMSKVHPVRSHSVAAAGGINAAISVDDDWHSHAYDTVKGSDFLGDQDAIEVMCSEAPAEVLHLEHIGVTFHRNDKGEMDLRAFGGASMKRTAYVADITGQALLHVLYEQLMKHHETVERYEEWFTTSLLQDDSGECCGVIARDVRSGRMEAFTAKNVILACGGAGQVYKPTTNGLIVTGDGIAMAYRAGAPLMDMEMVQYHPTTLVDSGILITEGARGEGAHLLNSDGERFMEKTAPNKMELASRDVVSRAEQIEIDEGRGVGPDGSGIYLDVTVVPRKRTLEALREIVNLGKDFAGVDITREPIRIRPGQHYIMGGVKTDVDGRTPIAGLYAAGEVACVSVHGGNRLGANSLLDTLIFGRRSGEDAAARAAEMSMPEVDVNAQLRRDAEEIDTIIARSRDGRRVSEIKNELGELMNRYAAVFRDEQGLQTARETIARLKEESQKAWIDDRGTVFNQDVLGAIERKESRGAQFRTDYPERNDEEWLKHIDITLSADGPQIGYSPVTITQWEPEERKY